MLVLPGRGVQAYLAQSLVRAKYARTRDLTTRIVQLNIYTISYKKDFVKKKIHCKILNLEYKF